MDISLFVVGDNKQAFILALEPEDISGTCTGDMAYLRFQANIKRGAAWSDRKLQGSLPILLELHGTLGIGTDGSGATLAPSNSLPLDLTGLENYPQGFHLAFICSRRYIQHLEEERARSIQARRMIFTFSLWGTVALVIPRHDALETAETQPIEPPLFGMPRETRFNVVGFKPIHNNRNEQLSVSLSHWDEMLPGLGYPNRRFIELPALEIQSMPEELREAATHINTAHTLFLQEKYRAAVQQCRQARDALLVPNKKNWCQEHLTGVMGTEKALMIDEAIQALTRLGHPASHGDNEVEVDRDAAEYVIGTMTLILHYIECKLR